MIWNVKYKKAANFGGLKLERLVYFIESVKSLLAFLYNIYSILQGWRKDNDR